MNLRAFSVFDTKAGTFSPPFFMLTVGLAVRTFQELANDNNTSIGRHPADFVLYEIGDFDQGNGVMTAAPTPINHGLAASYRFEPTDAAPLLNLVPKAAE